MILNFILNLDISFNKSKIIKELHKREIRGGYSSHYNQDCNYFDTFWALYLICCFGDDREMKPKFKLPPRSVWQIFLNFIVRLMFHEKPVIPNPFTTYDIDISKDNVLKHFKKNKYKSLKEIEYIGFELYKSLPINVKKTLKKRSTTGVLFNIQDDILDFPWEALLCGNTMVQFSRPVARKNKSEVKTCYMHSKRCLIVYDENLPSSVYEQKEIKQLLQNNNVSIKTMSFSNFSIKKIKNSYQIIHITGHSEKGIFFKNKKALKTLSIIDHMIKIKFNGLCICNFCNYQIEFLVKCKNAKFTILNYFGLLEGRIGYEFVKEVYNMLLSKNNIGEAVRVAKAKSLYFTDYIIKFLNYQLWGNPNLYL